MTGAGSAGFLMGNDILITERFGCAKLLAPEMGM